jgi:lipopolysaccharide transport system permease protein
VNQSLTNEENSIKNQTELSPFLSDDSPITILRPASSWYEIGWKEIWHYRELLYFLALRDLKVRYKQSLLGAAWVLLQPIATTVIFAVLFSRIVTTESFGVPYALFAFSGFVIWSFVNTAISSSGNSLINHTALITKTYFPRQIIPFAAVIAHLLDLAIGLLGLIVAMIIFGVWPTGKILLAPLFVILILVQVFAVGILLSALNVKFRDIKQLLPFALQFWMFLTPVFYSLKLLPEKYVWLWKLNPLTGALEGFRAAIFGSGFDWAAIAISVVITIVLVVTALLVFHRMEDDFADVI